MSGGGIAKIGEMALVAMAAPEVATMFASDAAPAAIDATASGSGGIGSLLNQTTQGVLNGTAAANPYALSAPGANTLSGINLAGNLTPGMGATASADALTSQLAQGALNPLDQIKQGVLNQITQGALNQTTQAAVPPPTGEAAQLSSFPKPIDTGVSSDAASLQAEGGRQLAAMQTAQGALNQQSGIGQLLKWAQENPAQAAAMGLGANYLFNKMATPNYLPGYTPPSAASYGLGRTLAAGYQPVRPMAGGGLTVGAGSVPTQGVAPSDLMQKPNQGAGLDSLAAQYGISPQMVSQARQTYGFSAGGPTEMAVGGKLLSGHGDGMSDSIKANISGSQEARLGDGEFVVPADVVSHLGNGSTDAGAKQLYSMMDKVRKARTGRKAQGRQINPQQYMPA